MGSRARRQKAASCSPSDSVYPHRVPPDAPSDEKPTKRPVSSSERTRSIVLMVLATLALTAVLTLATESLWRGPKPVPSTTGNAAMPSSGGAGVPALSPANVIIVAVTNDDIRVDGVPVAKTPPLAEAKTVSNIAPLQRAMEQKRTGRVGGRVGLAVEKGVPHSVIRSVFGTLAIAGYRDVHLVGAVPDGGLEAVLDGGVFGGRDE
jgi:hypothetical protein